MKPKGSKPSEEEGLIPIEACVALRDGCGQTAGVRGPLRMLGLSKALEVGARPRGPQEPTKTAGSPKSHRLDGGRCLEVLAPHLVEHLKHSLERNPSDSLCKPDKNILRNTSGSMVKPKSA
ncbi:hypothetical protein GUJ93_ZPchr0003g17097 [Zizania palustris]|uniref:Uncharacterized protein n=1 Tax=Zizania palustris TaxID=103762 RepID=A0A8J5S0V6_ZIZPA|nr:hypothetical protein GUJ93_ZPchr0003g17097 [Zizania palustris]